MATKPTLTPDIHRNPARRLGIDEITVNPNPEEFANRCQVHNCTVDSGPYVDVLGRSAGLERPLLSAAEYFEAAIDELEVDRAELAGRGRKPKPVRTRELLTVVGVERYGVSVKALAEVLGRHRVTVSS